jgi:hypothetical protein
MRHAEPHPLAGQTVTLILRAESDIHTGDEYRIEDYWDRVAGTSWMDAAGNPAAVKFAIRSGVAGLPIDDEVVYGKVGSFGHLVHVCELG